MSPALRSPDYWPCAFTSSVAQAQGVVNRGFSVPITKNATAADGTVQAITGQNIQRFGRANRTIYAIGSVVKPGFRVPGREKMYNI